MSEHLVHTGICDDTLRLAIAAGPALPTAFATVMRECRDLARLGGITRHADRHAVALLTAWRERPEDRAVRGKLAFLLGWLSHRAADRQFKPVFRAANPDSKLSPKDCSVYQDCWLWRRRFAGQDPDYGDGVFLRLGSGREGEAVAGLRSLVRTIMQGSLIAIHTFIPDDDQPDVWLDRVCRLHQAWRIDMDRYVAAALHPDPALVKRYIDDTCFYEPADPLIALCERLQAGGTATPDEVAAAAVAEQRSHYAQALATAWRYLGAAGAFWERRIDAAQLADALDHGRPGRDGKGV